MFKLDKKDTGLFGPGGVKFKILMAFIEILAGMIKGQSFLLPDIIPGNKITYRFHVSQVIIRVRYSEWLRCRKHTAIDPGSYSLSLTL